MDLIKLIEKVKVELDKAQYSDTYINEFETVWNHLKSYMLDNGINVFTTKVGIDFLEAEYGITVFSAYKELSAKNKRCIRAINLLSDYMLHGLIFPRTKRKIHTFPQFQTLFQEYIDKKRKEGISESTLRSYNVYLSRFSGYLKSQGISDIRDMNEAVVLGFTETFVRYSPSVIHNTLCSLRTFLHYLFDNEFVSRDFAYIVPHDGFRQKTKVPSAYPKEDIEKLLSSIDRGNPKGKRDYAMIIIAARLGLRAKDICNLSFHNLKWETNSIELLQNKTKKPMNLPMLEDVGLAIIDYLKYARPDCKTTDKIFLRLIPPLGKLNSSTLHSIVTQHMRSAGIKIDNGKKHGPHALRHSLASVLLEENTPLPIISEVLGHKNFESTSVYLKIDINQLRKCSLRPLAFDWNKGEEEF